MAVRTPSSTLFAIRLLANNVGTGTSSGGGLGRAFCSVLGGGSNFGNASCCPGGSTSAASTDSATLFVLRLPACGVGSICGGIAGSKNVNANPHPRASSSRTVIRMAFRKIFGEITMASRTSQSSFEKTRILTFHQLCFDLAFQGRSPRYQRAGGKTRCPIPIPFAGIRRRIDPRAPKPDVMAFAADGGGVADGRNRSGAEGMSR